MRWMKPLSVATVLTLTTAPAFAQHTRGGGESHGHAESRAAAESGGGQAAPARGGTFQTRGEAARQARGEAAQPARGESAQPGRGQASRPQNPEPPIRSTPPQASSVQAAPPSAPQAVGRAVPRAAAPSVPPSAGRPDAYGSRNNNGYGAPAPVGRSYDGSRGGYINTPPRGGYAVPRPSYPHAYPQVYRYGYGYRPRVVVPVVPYYRPYYAFRPHFSVGFGIYLGYPVAYPYAYGYPTYVYGGGGSYDPYYNVAPSSGAYGGISFEISPTDADVYIDGNYVGRSGDFSPMYQPLTVTPGRHQVELNAPNCEPLVFEVDIQPGQVLPYRGSLRPY